MCSMIYLSGVTGNAGLAVEVFQRLQNVSAIHVCTDSLYFLKSLLHSLLFVFHTLPARGQ